MSINQLLQIPLDKKIPSQPTITHNCGKQSDCTLINIVSN